jgi:hypothetical protein
MLLQSDALVAYDLADGHELWRIPWKADWSVNAASPVFVDGKVLLTAGYGSGRTALFDVSSGSPKKLWQNDELKSRIESLVVFGGRVYGVSEAKRGSLMCLDLTSGKTVWQQPGFGKFAGLMVAGGKLVVLSEDGQLVIANTGDKYEEIARQKVLGDRCWVMPVVSNGLIFCRNNVGDVAVVDVRPRK